MEADKLQVAIISDLLPISSVEQISNRPFRSPGQPAPDAVLFAIVQKVASLAERREVRSGIVGDIVIEMSTGQNDPRPPAVEVCRKIRRGAEVRSNETPFSVAPASDLIIVPAAIAKVADDSTMRAGTMLAAALGATEADRVR